MRAATIVFAIVLVSLSTFAQSAQPQEAVLYAFGGIGADGRDPQGPLVMDAAGNLYGEDSFGGQYFNGDIFELTPVSGGMWQRTDLYSFPGGRAGSFPLGGLTIDTEGNLYGSTEAGGSGSEVCGEGFGCGVIFELSHNSSGQWKYTALHIFEGNKDGYGPYGFPAAPLVLDKLGNLYGTSQDGGEPCLDGCGLVFKLSRSLGWQKSTLRAFAGYGDGAHPTGSIVFDSAGNLYGATNAGGRFSSNCLTGCGVVFELSPAVSGSWKETVLHSFNFTDGAGPLAGVAFDASGNLYGTTTDGGTPGACASYGTDGCGEVFELSPSSSGWKESVIHAFTGGSDGGAPYAGVTVNRTTSDLYGATPTGGLSSCDCGVIFKLTQREGGGWQKEVLFAFDQSDGTGPTTNLILDGAGNLYAASPLGGVVVQTVCTYGCGLIFELTPTN